VLELLHCIASFIKHPLCPAMMLVLQLLCVLLVALESSTALLIMMSTGSQLSVRRSFLQSGFTAAAVIAAAPVAALAKEDCMKDCLRNCNKVAPGSPDYCKDSCTDYCAETDRKDGLSGSVSDEGGEVSTASTRYYFAAQRGAYFNSLTHQQFIKKL
jgi:hypothetical protein